MGIRFVLRDFFHFLSKPGGMLPGVPGIFSSRVAVILFLSLSVIRFTGIFVEVAGLRPLVMYFTGQELARQQVSSSTVGLFIGALVMAPLLEETAYRWGLRFNPLRTSVSMGLVSFYWLPYGGTYSTTIVDVLNKPGFYLMVATALVTFLTTYALLSVPFLRQQVEHKWKRNFGWIFYASVLPAIWPDAHLQCARYFSDRCEPGPVHHFSTDCARAFQRLCADAIRYGASHCAACAFQPAAGSDSVDRIAPASFNAWKSPAQFLQDESEGAFYKSGR
jgi:uncharacterized protein